MRKIGRYGVAAAVALVAASLVGCDSDDPEPKISPSSTVSTSASPSPTSTSPTTEAETPEAFIRRWNQLSTEMQNTGETAGFRALSDGCQACIDVATTVERYYAAGGFVRTDGWKFRSLSCGASGGSRTECTGRMLNSPTVYAESGSSPEQRLPGGPFVEVFDLHKTADGWLMSHIAEKAT
jgi:hypothetical protein